MFWCKTEVYALSVERDCTNWAPANNNNRRFMLKGFSTKVSHCEEDQNCSEKMIKSGKDEARTTGRQTPDFWRGPTRLLYISNKIIWIFWADRHLARVHVSIRPILWHASKERPTLRMQHGCANQPPRQAVTPFGLPIVFSDEPLRFKCSGGWLLISQAKYTQQQN